VTERRRWYCTRLFQAENTIYSPKHRLHSEQIQTYKLDEKKNNRRNKERTKRKKKKKERKKERKKQIKKEKYIKKKN
jgi:hypothetical protein